MPLAGLTICFARPYTCGMKTKPTTILEAVKQWFNRLRAAPTHCQECGKGISAENTGFRYCSDDCHVDFLTRTNF